MPNLLPLDVFFQDENAVKLFSAGALPRTPLEELVTLPQIPHRLVRTEGGTPSPFLSHRHLFLHVI